MNNRETFLWALAMVCCALVLMSPVACTVQRQQTVAEAIKGGADPIAAKCAIEGDTSMSPVCLAYAMRSKP